MWIFELTVLILMIGIVILAFIFRYYLSPKPIGEYVLTSSSPCINNEKYNFYTCQGGPCYENFLNMTYKTKTEKVSCSPNDQLDQLMVVLESNVHRCLEGICEVKSEEGKIILGSFNPEKISNQEVLLPSQNRVSRQNENWFLNGEKSSLATILAADRSYAPLARKNNSFPERFVEAPKKERKDIIFSHICQAEVLEKGTFTTFEIIQHCIKVEKPVIGYFLKLDSKFYCGENYQLSLKDCPQYCSEKDWVREEAAVFLFKDSKIYVFLKDGSMGYYSSLNEKLFSEMVFSKGLEYEIYEEMAAESLYSDPLNLIFQRKQTCIF